MKRHRNRKRSASIHRRVLRSETLEPRLVLAVDLPFQNPGQPLDVNRDLSVTALDALQVINFITRNGYRFCPARDKCLHPLPGRQWQRHGDRA